MCIGGLTIWAIGQVDGTMSREHRTNIVFSFSHSQTHFYSRLINTISLERSKFPESFFKLIIITFFFFLTIYHQIHTTA